MIKLHKRMSNPVKINIIDIDSIATAIEKTEGILKNTTNPVARITWERNMYRLRLAWSEAMIAVETNGQYNFFN